MARIVTALTLAALLAPASAQTIVSQFLVAPTGTAFVGGLEYDCSNNIVWVADENNDTISAYDGAGNFLKTYAAMPPGTATNPQPIGIGQDPNTGMLWIGDENEYVYELDPATGLQTGAMFSTLPTVTDVSGVAVDPLTGNVFVSQDSGTRQIVEFSQTGAVITVIPLNMTPSTDPDGLAYDVTTGLFYLGDDIGDSVYEVDVTGTTTNTWSLAGLGISPEGVGLDSANGLVYIGDGFVTRQVYVVSGMISPGGLCVPAPPLFNISVTTTGAGDINAIVSNIPTGTVEGWTLYSLDTSTPVCGGPVFGGTPDANTLAILASTPIPLPGNPFHWTWPAVGFYPATPLSLPPGTMNAFAGTSWDFLAIAVDGTGALTPTFNVCRTTW